MKRLLTLLVVAFLLISCSPPSQSPRLLSWAYADLRALKSPGQVDNSLQLVALYTRLADAELQIRLDLLDYEAGDPLDIYLALDTNPGGKRDLPFGGQTSFDWDSLVSLPASGPIQAIDVRGNQINNLRLRVERDPVYDDIVISLDSNALPRGLAGLGLQAFALHSREHKIASSIGPVQADASPPPPANILLAFWNTFPAVTPAQALRLWDGAHTGPNNGRFGLRHILGASASYHIPIFLLDLKSATNLAALDTVGGLPVIKSLEKQGLAILPDVQPLSSGPVGSPFSLDNWTIDQVLAKRRQVVESYGLTASQALYSPVFLSDPRSHGSILFYQHPQSDPPSPGGTISTCQRWQNIRVIPIPTTPGFFQPEEQQATQNGLSILVRRNLLQIAALPDSSSNDFLLLGGDLTQSAWGDPSIGRPAMEYIARHPWIHVLRLEDLLTCVPSGLYLPDNVISSTILTSGAADDSFISTGLTVNQLQAQVESDLGQAAPGPLKDAAWKAYFTLLTPGQPDVPDLWKLRSGYFASIGYLLAANKWAIAPPNTDKVQMQTGDIDWDGQDEIILTSSSLFLVIEQDGGYLAAGFYRDQDGPHEIIGPSSQFYIGISDPTLWKPERGPAGDPEQVRGAFSEIPIGYISPSWDPYSASWQAGVLTLQSPDGKVTKRFQVRPNGVFVDYQSTDPIEVQVPLVLDPWVTGRPGWEKQYESSVKILNWTWGIKDGIKVDLTTTGELEPHAFSDSREALLSPENPNYNFTPGHYLPFPMAVGVIQGEGKFSISLVFHK